MDIFTLIVFGIVVGLNIFYAWLTFQTAKRDTERENRLLKALIAKNLQEYSLAEASPDEQIKKMQVENDLATKAVEIEREQSKREIIPIT